MKRFISIIIVLAILLGANIWLCERVTAAESVTKSFDVNEFTPIPEDEAAQIRRFLSMKNEAGISNGEQVAGRRGLVYDPYDCSTWRSCVSFHSQTGHVLAIGIFDKQIDLVGELCLDNFESLTTVSIKGNHLTKLSLKNCPSLVVVDCQDSLCETEFEFAHTPNVDQLWISGTKCNELDVSAMPRLEQLHAIGCGLTYVDISHNPRLRTLYANANPLYGITYGSNTYLSTVKISHARFTEISFSDLPNLAFVDTSRLNIDSCIINNCPKLVRLILANTNLSLLDFDSLERLSYLNVEGNTRFAVLDTASLFRLNELYANNTALEELDLSSSKYLSFVRANNSCLKKLNLPSDAEYLYGLECRDNQLTELDLSTATYLYWLDCSNYNIAELEFNLIQKCFEVLYAGGNPTRRMIRAMHSSKSTAPDHATFDMFSLGLGHTEYNGKRISAVCSTGSSFYGWYDKEGTLISLEKTLNVDSGEYCELTYFEARFTGYENETPEPASEPYTVPQKVYDETEVSILRKFFLTEAIDGITNAERLNGYDSSFDIDDPAQWWCCSFNEDGHLVTLKTAGGPDNGLCMVGDLDLSGFSALETVQVECRTLLSQYAPMEYQGLSTLNLSNCPKLRYVRAAHNTTLTHIDLSGSPNIEHINLLDCRSLESINVSDCTRLEYLILDNSKLVTHLDLMNNPKLDCLFASNTSISSFDFSHNPALEYIDVSGNNLGKLIIPENDNLVGFACVGCNLPALDLSGCKNLTRLLVSDNPFTTELDLSPLTNLTELQCDNCNLASLDTSHNVKLETLMCDDNALTALDLRDNQALHVLSCADNNLATLDLSVLDTETLHHCVTTGNPLTAITGAKRASGYGEGSFDVTVSGKGYAAVVGRKLVAQCADDEYVFCGWYDENGELISRDEKCVIPESGTKFEARFIDPGLGDCNMDGVVNTGDAVLVLKSCVGIAALTERQTALADMNADGNINTGDAVAVLRLCVGTKNNA